MTENKHLPAYPTPCAINENGVYTTHAAQQGWELIGFSKRELGAFMCLQGLLANPVYNNPDLKHKMVTVPDAAKCALDYADALLTHLA